MGARGPKSVAARLVPKAVEAVDRLPPSVHLSDAERQVWLELMADQPAEAFRPTHVPLLEMYCRHVVNYRVLGDEILNFDRSWLSDADGLKRYDRLLAMCEREGRAASSLATRLRITRQAVHEEKAGRAFASVAKTLKPWETTRRQSVDA